MFDVIRYPISDAPTAEELLRIPPNLYIQWLHKIIRSDVLQYGDLDYYSACNMPFEIAKWPKDTASRCVQDLRILIRSYEEDRP